MNKSTTVDWTVKGYWCKHSFLVSEATITEDRFIVCPVCKSWSGFEMVSRRANAKPVEVQTPATDRLIHELYAWVVTDPRTTLQSMIGLVLDGMPVQAISSSRENAMRMRGQIARAVEKSEKKIQLIRFKSSEVIDEIKP